MKNEEMKEEKKNKMPQTTKSIEAILLENIGSQS